ncbi:MAG: DUF5103 domain-containing protein [Pseudoflavonifractor sp.]|nr:DUF5103 domain-containing protein [Pseudoflavonifractor sp.]
MRLGILVASVVVAACGSVATAADVDTMNGTFNPRFRSLQVTVDGDEQALPVIALNGEDKITISFDEIAEDREYYQYSLVHCNADWQPSGLVDTEFLDGFNVGQVDDYRFSEATTVHYVHYRITIPNEEMRITASGNYLLTVYPENEPENVVVQARFSVTEYSMKVSGGVTSRTDVDYNDCHQQLSIVVDTDNFRPNDIYNDIKVVITQNGREDNKVMLRQPLRVSGNKAYYEHQRPLIFDAGNEYRRMETVSMTYPGMGVAEIVYAAPYYHQQLRVDKPRNMESYNFDRTQYGRFKIREYNSDDSDVGADYAMTHFSLEMPRLDGYDIFLDGDFTGRRFDPGSLMHYNNLTQRYETSLLLKQGAYNYQYLAVPSGTMRGETSVVEGDFYPTVNEYAVKVYCRRPGERYDRLTAVTLIYSGR